MERVILIFFNRSLKESPVMYFYYSCRLCVEIYPKRMNNDETGASILCLFLMGKCIPAREEECLLTKHHRKIR